MGLETGTYISDLNASNPVNATDPVSQGDDHLRLIKSVLQNSINLSGQVTSTHTELNYLDGVTGVTGSGNLVLSAAPTLTGTLTAAAANFSGALTALSYGGITEANLVDKSASEVISGATWDFQAITAVSFGGIASANLLDKSAVETVSGAYTFTGDVNIGNADTTLSRSAAGKLEVEGAPIVSHNDATKAGGQVYFSTSDPSGGVDGDIWFKHEA